MKKTQNKKISKVLCNKRADSNDAYKLLAPAFIILLVFMAYPLINSIIMAFQHYQLTYVNEIGTFAGFDNFIKIFTDPNLKQIVGNTLVFVVVSLALQFFLGFALALALRKPFRGRNVYQAVVFLPWAISSFIVGLTFKWLFNGEYGAINDILMKLGIISDKIPWLGSPDTALFTVICGMVWIGVPFFAIMILAALQSIPNDIYEAADIDGASSPVKFFKITLPYVKPTIVMTLLLRTMWIFNSADLIFVMTNGGPANSSHTLASYMFNKAYQSLDFGQAAALGVLFIVIMAVYVCIYLKATKYNEAGDF